VLAIQLALGFRVTV